METPAADRLWALVLAGGDGTRLQALTRLIAGAPIPKQYCRIVGDRSLLETTLARIAPLVRRERTLAIVNRGHLSLARPQLAAIPTSNVLVQPQNLDTGPGLLVSLLALARRDAGRDGGRLPERSRHARRDRLPAARGPHGVSRGHRAHPRGAARRPAVACAALGDGVRGARGRRSRRWDSASFRLPAVASHPQTATAASASRCLATPATRGVPTRRGRCAARLGMDNSGTDPVRSAQGNPMFHQKYLDGDSALVAFSWSLRSIDS